MKSIIVINLLYLLWVLLSLGTAGNEISMIVLFANVVFAIIYWHLSKRVAWFSKWFLLALPVGALFGLWISFDSTLNDIVFITLFCAYVSNAVGMLALSLFISNKIETNTRNISRRKILSQKIQSSMPGAAMSGISPYQGRLSSFAMPMLDQNASVRSPNEHIFQSAIHPTTGFPMINESVDIAGNPIGMAMHDSTHSLFQPNINPASGMPMMNDSMDIHGSPYGVSGMHDMHSGMSSGFDSHCHHDIHSPSSMHYDHHNPY